MTKEEQIEARLDCEARVQKAVEQVILEPCVAGEQIKKVKRALVTGEQVRTLVDDKGVVDDGDNLDRMSEDTLALAFASRDPLNEGATPEELAYMTREIELHEDEELNVGVKP